ncbi:hypothetical protein RCL1_000693 [Eukaryota sp. TZLM3-RCL]
MSHTNLGQLQTDQTELQFFYPAFFAHFGELTLDNVLEYFYCSPFYDKSSANELVRVQGLSPDQIPLIANVVAYEVKTPLCKPPQFFVIAKVYRSTPGADSQVLAYYYIKHGTIFQSPALLHVFHSRFNNICFHLSAAASVVSDKTVYSLDQGYLLKDVEGGSVATTRTQVFPVNEQLMALVGL